MPRSFPLHCETLVLREDLPLSAITRMLATFCHTLKLRHGD
jgi:hypothetical protein